MSKRKNYQVKDGRVTVKNISAYWLDDITVQETIHGTTYIVDGSYEGNSHEKNKNFSDIFPSIFVITLEGLKSERKAGARHQRSRGGDNL